VISGYELESKSTMYYYGTIKFSYRENESQTSHAAPYLPVLDA
jgi:hypothetical protein